MIIKSHFDHFDSFSFIQSSLGTALSRVSLEIYHLLTTAILFIYDGVLFF